MGNGGSLQEKIAKESDDFQDVLQIEWLEEDYFNISLKTVYSLKFFNDRSKFSELFW